MKRQAPLQTLYDLQNAQSDSTRVEALKAIKHDLTGHLSRKSLFVNAGLIDALAAALPSLDSSRDVNQLYLQSSQVLAVLAHEGPLLLRPLLTTAILPQLIASLTAPTSPKTSLAVLKSLVAIADHLPAHLADLLYSKPHIRCFAYIIRRAGSEAQSPQACDLSLTLMCKTVATDAHKRALVEAGVLSALAARLASFVVAQGLVPPSSDTLGLDNGPSDVIPDPAPSSAHLSPVLESIALLIDKSKSRSRLFIKDPSIKLVLPDQRDGFSPSDIRRGPWGGSYFSGAAVPRNSTHGPFDPLLPYVPTTDKSLSNDQTGFPPLGPVLPSPKRRTSFLPTSTPNPDLSQLTFGSVDAEEGQESSVVPYLLYLVRESRGKRRLLATKLLVALYNLGHVRRHRRSTFTSLLAPLLTRMLEPDLSQDPLHQNPGSLLCNGLHYTKAVPAVLAGLINDNADMQKVAVESKAISNLSTSLKMTFESPLEQKLAPWQPSKVSENMVDDRMGDNETDQDNVEIPLPLRREMHLREGCLQALAAIALFRDSYRNEICAQGVLTHIMAALEPLHIHTHASGATEIRGNTTPVILAACGAVQVLTRSVQALRTKLIEAEVIKPIVLLMSSTNADIRIAATMVLTNLAIDFSPMKDGVGESTMVKKLCEQAHSANARLRLESLWALKQLVLNASKKLKQEVVDELGASWIKLLIKTDPNDIPEGEVIGLVERDYPPLNTFRPLPSPHVAGKDVVMSDDSDDSEGDEEKQEEDESTSPGFSTKHTVEDDTEIQAQLLDLLRNLFCGDNASDLVKYVFDEMGQDDFFQILVDRLKPRPAALGPTRKDDHTIAAPSVIVIRVLYILVHIAACEPRWRNALASNHALTKQVLTFFSHSDREIRATCCWIATSLTYEDDSSSRTLCRQRALELHKVGFMQQLKKLENDADLNVRERARAAVHLITKLIAS
ncbi:hypothetical protein B0A52_09665 [Exophiala mesophila]|uniref:Uncharacterized protein n=1 Tax=Exophiala mesophila TaxID=212818 RepID=A0A438MTQ2_EXOME|nr:hypothetical protein B0A52_09665 [Exophiala mesophila]